MAGLRRITTVYARHPVQSCTISFVTLDGLGSLATA